MQRTALVTGANRGIGKEITRQLAAAGLKVFLGSRDPEKGRTAALEIGGDTEAVQLDMNDPKSITDVAATLDRLDVLVNNAGIIGNSNATELDVQQFDAVMRTNLSGPVKLAAALLPLLRKSNDARIINMSSGMGAMSDMTGGYAPYRISKWALNGWTMLLGSELQGSNVSVYAMCPGWVRTDMGGVGASRSVEQGADTATWLATTDPAPPTSHFFRDRAVIPW